jgi:signal transduction histidine kinase/DNA-binding response OmpR family regulator
MHRILILDNDQNLAQSLKLSAQDFDELERIEIDLATTSDDAFERTKLASQLGRSYTMFLINQGLELAKDGIATMKELLEISSYSDAIIFKGAENSKERMRAYEAGAKRYLSKTSELEEILFILNDVAQSRRKRFEEIRQRRQFRIAKEIAETVGAELNLESVMEAILQKLFEIFEETSLCVLLYDRKSRALKFAPATLKFYKTQDSRIKKKNMFYLNRGSIACRVARESLIKKASVFEIVGNVTEDADYIALNPMINSEFCISLLNSKSNLLGVLVLEREKINGFANDDIDLAQTVAQHLSIAIERAQISEELEYKSTIAAKTSWAAEMAHEINNAVYVIQTSAYLIKNIAEKESDIYKHAENISISMANLANTGQYRDQAPIIVDVDDDIRTYVVGICRKRGITPIFKLGAREIRIKVNRAGFHYIFKQLIDNASRAMKTCDDKKILVVTKIKNNRKIEILFKDFGLGIDDDIHLSLFHRPVTTKDSGGYGLLLVRQIVEEMNGQIALKPYRKGHGAEFSIQIPYSGLTTNKT